MSDNEIFLRAILRSHEQAEAYCIFEAIRSDCDLEYRAEARHHNKEIECLHAKLKGI